MTETHFGEETVIESGSIVMWSGTLSNIPAGWVLCDGNNGTPNLLGDFTKGDTDTSTSPGATGGSDSITLSVSQLPNHDHTVTTGTNGAHNHDFDTAGMDQTGDDNTVTSGLDGNWFTQAAGSHTHSVSIGLTGGDGSINNLPSFFEVAYIMKT